MAGGQDGVECSVAKEANYMLSETSSLYLVFLYSFFAFVIIFDFFITIRDNRMHITKEANYMLFSETSSLEKRLKNIARCTTDPRSSTGFCFDAVSNLKEGSGREIECQLGGR